MAKVRVVMNHQGSAQLLKSAEVQAFLLSVAQGKAAENVADAPRKSGDYADSIEAWAEVHPTRAVARYGPTLNQPYATYIAAETLHL